MESEEVQRYTMKILALYKMNYQKIWSQLQLKTILVEPFQCIL